MSFMTDYLKIETHPGDTKWIRHLVFTGQADAGEQSVSVQFCDEMTKLRPCTFARVLRELADKIEENFPDPLKKLWEEDEL